MHVSKCMHTCTYILTDKEFKLHTKIVIELTDESTDTTSQMDHPTSSIVMESVACQPTSYIKKIDKKNKTSVKTRPRVDPIIFLT